MGSARRSRSPSRRSRGQTTAQSSPYSSTREVLGQTLRNLRVVDPELTRARRQFTRKWLKEEEEPYVLNPEHLRASKWALRKTGEHLPTPQRRPTPSHRRSPAHTPSRRSKPRSSTAQSRQKLVLNPDSPKEWRKNLRHVTPVQMRRRRAQAEIRAEKQRRHSWRKSLRRVRSPSRRRKRSGQ